MGAPLKPLLLGITFAFVATIAAACGADQLDKDPGTTSDVVPKKTLKNEANSQDPANDEAKRTPIDLASECKKYIGEIMGRSPASMKVDHQREPGRLVGISYIRSNDGKKLSYECKTDGVSIVWRGVDIFASGDGPGRWRDEEAKPIKFI